MGDRFIYIARIARPVAGQLGLASGQSHLYFALAALRVTQVWESYQQAVRQLWAAAARGHPAGDTISTQPRLRATPSRNRRSGVLDHFR